MRVDFGFKLKGEFKAILYNEDGSIAYESDWDRNIITNNGLILYGGSNWWQECAIGSGSTAAAITDSSIQNFLGQDDSRSNAAQFADYPRPPVAPDYERYSINKYRFNAGNGTGTVREFTIGLGSNGTNIFCRHVLGTAIPKAANQVLDVFYRITVYPELTRRTGTIVIGGDTYDWTAGIYDVTNFNYTLFARARVDHVFPSQLRTSEGGIPAILDEGLPAPDLTGTDVNEVFLGGGSGYYDTKFEVGLDSNNMAGGTITCIGGLTGQNFRVFVHVDKQVGGGGFTKNNTYIFDVTFRLIYGRYP